MKRVAIVGGGISGVTAAYECSLHPAEIECTLYEVTSRLGGTVKTSHITLQGCGKFLVELGPDGWVSDKPWARELAEELGLTTQLVPSNDAVRKTLLLRDGQLLAFPAGMRMMVPLDQQAVERTDWLSDTAKAAYRHEPQRAIELRELAANTMDISVAAFVRRHYGEEVTRTIAGPLLAGVFGGDIERLSAGSVLPAFLAIERQHGSLALGLRAQAKRSDRPTRSIFTALQGGNESLIATMAAGLPTSRARLNTSVEAISRDSTGWRVRTAGEEATFDTIMLATPARVTRNLLEAVDPELAELHSIPASSGVLAALLYRQATPLPEGFGFLVQQPQAGFDPSLLAVTFSHQKYPHCVPEGAMLLRVFFGGPAVQQVEALADTTIVAKAQSQLQMLFPGLQECDASVVQRWPHSLPQYELGHEDRVAAIDQRAAALPGLHLLGNAYRGVGLPDMVRRARQSVQNARND